jgi:branched-chain amino acid transport system permease protein
MIMLKKISSPNFLILLAFVLFTLILPLILGSNQYRMVLATTVIMFAVMATSWNLIGGLGGQLDLAAGAYVGLGAFTTGTLVTRLNISPWIGIPLGGLVAAGIAALIGAPLFRFHVSGVWYVLSTSALVVVLYTTFMMWDSVGGPMDRYLPRYDFSLYYLRFNTYVPYYYLLLALLYIALFLNYYIRNTRLGYQLRAIGESEAAAEVLGVNARNSKLKALMIYAFLVGVTGGIYSCIYGYYHPRFFDSNLSVEIAILGIVGGLGIPYGPLLAAIILVSGREFLRSSLGTVVEGAYMAVYAVILVVIALYRPAGLAALVQDTYKAGKTHFSKDNHVKPPDITGE